MLDKAFKCLLKARFVLILQGKIHDLGNLVSGTSILPLANKIKTLIKLKPLTNIKEVKTFSQTYRLLPEIHMQLCSYCAPLKSLNAQIPTFCLDPRMSIQF